MNKTIPYPMRHIHFDWPPLPVRGIDMGDPMGDITVKISAQVADMTDSAIVEAILQVAKEEGLTDLYLIDREFILRALRNELERMVKEDAL